ASETSVQVQQFSTDVAPHGTLPMELLPETTNGNFFNTQSRSTSTTQWIQTVSGTRAAWGGLHAIKAGVDVLHTEYAGSSVSRPVLVRASDGTLMRRIDFVGPLFQSVRSTGVALFAQDRVQVTSRWLLEFGGRLDRDGIVGGL